MGGRSGAARARSNLVDMIFVLILRAALGPAIVGHFDDEKSCQEAAARYVAMLVEQRSDDKHNAQMACVGFPIAMPTPPITKEA
jgi:hypothetical protein